MKVLIYHPYFFVRGGAEKLVLEYIKRSKFKFDILTWYMDYNSFPEFKEYKIIKLLHDYIHNFAQKLPIKSPPYLISSFFNLRRIFENYDIVLVSTAGLVELTLIRNKSDNIVFYCHTPLRAASYFDYKRNTIYRFKNPILKYIYKTGAHFYNKLEKIAWKIPKFVIFNSKLTRERALTKNLIDVRKTKVIYPGATLPKFKNTRCEDYLLYVSRIDFHKRQHVVLKAWKKFAKRHKDYKLILAGGRGNLYYVKYILKLSKEIPNVKIYLNLPYQKILDLYSKALAVTYIPFMEDFGIVPLEASTAGKYVINVYPSGNFEILKDFPGIYWIRERFYDEKMVEEVYKALEFFVKNQDELIEKGKENRKKMKELDLSWDRFAKEMDKTLKHIYRNYI